MREIKAVKSDQGSGEMRIFSRNLAKSRFQIVVWPSDDIENGLAEIAFSSQVYSEEVGKLVLNEDNQQRAWQNQRHHPHPTQEN